MGSNLEVIQSTRSRPGRFQPGLLSKMMDTFMLIQMSEKLEGLRDFEFFFPMSHKLERFWDSKINSSDLFQIIRTSCLHQRRLFKTYHVKETFRNLSSQNKKVKQSFDGSIYCTMFVKNHCNRFTMSLLLSNAFLNDLNYFQTPGETLGFFYPLVEKYNCMFA